MKKKNAEETTSIFDPEADLATTFASGMKYRCEMNQGMGQEGADKPRPFMRHWRRG